MKMDNLNTGDIVCDAAPVDVANSFDECSGADPNFANNDMKASDANTNNNNNPSCPEMCQHDQIPQASSSERCQKSQYTRLADGACKVAAESIEESSRSHMPEGKPGLVSSPKMITGLSKEGEKERSKPNPGEKPKKKSLVNKLLSIRLKEKTEPISIEMQPQRYECVPEKSEFIKTAEISNASRQPSLQEAVEPVEKRNQNGEKTALISEEDSLQIPDISSTEPSPKHTKVCSIEDECSHDTDSSVAAEETDTSDGADSMGGKSNVGSIESLDIGKNDVESSDSDGDLHDLEASQSSNFNLGSIPLPKGISISEDEYPPEYQEIQYDCVLIYAESDKDSALRFKEVVENIIKLKSGKPSVCLLDHRGTLTWLQSRFDHLEEAMKRSTYILLYVTDDFCDTAWGQMQRDEVLMETLDNPNRLWCLIPVYAQPFYNNNPKKRHPSHRFGFAALKPLDLGRILNDKKLEDVSVSEFHKLLKKRDRFFVRFLRKVFNQRLYLKQRRTEQNLKDLRKWIIDEGERRYREKRIMEVKEEKERRLREQQRIQFESELQTSSEDLTQFGRSTLPGFSNDRSDGMPVYGHGPRFTLPPPQGYPHGYMGHYHPAYPNFYPSGLPPGPPGLHAHMMPPYCGYNTMLRPPVQHTTYNINKVGFLSQGNENQVKMNVMDSDFSLAEENSVYEEPLEYPVAIPSPSENNQLNYNAEAVCSENLKDTVCGSGELESSQGPSTDPEETGPCEHDEGNISGSTRDPGNPERNFSQSFSSTCDPVQPEQAFDNYSWKKGRTQQFPTESACPVYGAERQVRVTYDYGDVQSTDYLDVYSACTDASSMGGSSGDELLVSGPCAKSTGDSPNVRRFPKDSGYMLPKTPPIAKVRPLVQHYSDSCEEKYTGKHIKEDETFLKTPVESGQTAQPKWDEQQTYVKLPASSNSRHLFQSPPLYESTVNSYRHETVGENQSINNSTESHTEFGLYMTNVHPGHRLSPEGRSVSSENQVSIIRQIRTDAHEELSKENDVDVDENKPESNEVKVSSFVNQSSVYPGPSSIEKSTGAGSGVATKFCSRESNTRSLPYQGSGEGQRMPQYGGYTEDQRLASIVGVPTSWPSPSFRPAEHHSTGEHGQAMSYGDVPQLSGDIAMHNSGIVSGPSGTGPSFTSIPHPYDINSYGEGLPIMNPYMWPGYAYPGPNYGPVPRGAGTQGFHGVVQHENNQRYSVPRRNTSEID